MSASPIVYCECSGARTGDQRVRGAVSAALGGAAQAHRVSDLCELAARRDERLIEWARLPGLRVVACYPRAVRWLFHRAGAALAPDALVLNTRTQSAADILAACGLSALAGEPSLPHPPAPPAAGAWTPWFPVIDYDRCRQCRQCVSFCLFGVYRQAPQDTPWAAAGQVEVIEPTHCKTGCPACARVCPHAAIVFPKYSGGPIDGDERTSPGQAVAVDVRQLARGDIERLLRSRQDGQAP
jgi:Pyruvate/2-oxoacid:ferredoxin oxidoreductase delta subunit